MFLSKIPFYHESVVYIKFDRKWPHFVYFESTNSATLWATFDMTICRKAENSHMLDKPCLEEKERWFLCQKSWCSQQILRVIIEGEIIVWSKSVVFQPTKHTVQTVSWIVFLFHDRIHNTYPRSGASTIRELDSICFLKSVILLQTSF